MVVVLAGFVLRDFDRASGLAVRPRFERLGFGDTAAVETSSGRLLRLPGYRMGWGPSMSHSEPQRPLLSLETENHVGRGYRGKSLEFPRVIFLQENTPRRRLTPPHPQAALPYCGLLVASDRSLPRSFAAKSQKHIVLGYQWADCSQKAYDSGMEGSTTEEMLSVALYKFSKW